MANPNGSRLERRIGEILRERARQLIAWEGGSFVADTESAISEREWTEPSWEQSGLADPSWWFFEPAVGRVANGISSRVDRLKSLGNAIVPQIAQIIGQAILELEKEDA